MSATNILDEHFAADVAHAIARCRLPPRALTMEVTENIIMADPERAMAVLGELSELGVGIALDDFGTGYSSLAQLKRSPSTSSRSTARS